MRNFPKLALGLFNIVNTMSMLSPWKEAVDSRNPDGSADRVVLTLLKSQIREMQNEMKRMLRTRSSGRPKKAVTDSLPEIVSSVIRVAREMMGDERGKDAVPGLKQIADTLDVSENALSRRLTRAGFPWLKIRTDLENLPKIENEFMADDKNPD